MTDLLTPLALTPGALADLRARHAGPGRHYHTWQHVLEVLGHLADQPEAPVESVLAALLHDVVYVAGRSDNEARSASLARTWIPANVGVPADVDRVVQLIAWTAAHGRLEPDDVDPVGALFLDADMAILAAPPSRFDAYVDQVTREWVPVIGADAWADGRRRFVERLLAGRIYLSPWGAALEERARANLGRTR